ncbi:MAG: S8 family serine peptidase, partial [Halanaerobiales bacterium]
SNYGPGLDLVAPGGDDSVMDKSNNTILSTAGYIESNNNPVHQYTWAQGTSMAAPHVSGLVALLYSNGIDNPESVIQLLKETADDLGMSGEDNYYGAGLININRTLQLDNGDDSGDFDNKGPFDFSQIKIIARSEKNEKSIITPDNDGQFSLSLPEGTWDIIALIDSNDNNKTDRDESYKKYSVEIPETDHLVIEF